MDTRTRILSGARELLFTRGYTDFTLETLAEHLGIARKTIYNHFPSRENLVEATFVYDARLWVEDVSRLVASTTLPFTEKANQLMRQSAARLRERGAVFVQAAGLRRQLLREQNAKTFREVVIVPLSRLFSEGIASGHIRPDINPEMLTRALLNVIFGHELRADDRPDALATILEEILFALSVGVLTERGRKEVSVERRKHE